ncbi:hypothetical protein N8G13_02015 [Mycoplasma zalophi]|uniref:MAG3240 family lipoprotein n=1 Tax=Mycoplasma zalophi TaxID=191287 RepID=UPI0021CA0B9E|nr:hypothetical protein [Mycoplasma zalophi]MCU4117230.1 hypothetical protein [Mycoplasma zalophi]
MKKWYLINAIMFSTIISAPVFTISCSFENKNKKEVYLDINKISRVFLNRLSLNQIASLEKDENIFYYFDYEGKHKFNNVKIENNKLLLQKQNKWIEYVPDFPYKNNWKQIDSNNANIRIFDSNEKSNINDFLTEYNFDVIDSAGTVNDDWYTSLSILNKKDYSRIGDPYFEDLQTIIFRLNSDIRINYSIMNSKYLINTHNTKTLFNNWIQTQYIQASSFLSKDNKNMRDDFAKILKLYINKFNVDIANIDIDWSDSKIIHSYSDNGDYVTFKIKSIRDWNNEELLTKENQNKIFYLNGFRNYATDGKFGVGVKGLKEDLPLFTDYIQNPLLKMDGKNYITIIDNINNFIKSSTSIEYWNTKGLMNLLSTFKDDILSLDIPKHKQNEDLEYKIIDFQFTNYLDTNQIFKAIVRVTKKDKTFKDYVLLSSNFDDHGHRLKGLILKNAPSYLLKPGDIYSYKPSNKGIKKGIKLEDFITDDKQSAFMEALNNAADKIDNLYKYWNNDSRQNFDPLMLTNDSYQIKIFNAYLNNYLLAYALENNENETLSGIKKIKINVIPSKSTVGRLYFELNFIPFENQNDLNYENENEKSIATVSMYWNKFKGYSNNKDSNFNLVKFERKNNNV